MSCQAAYKRHDCRGTDLSHYDLSYGRVAGMYKTSESESWGRYDNIEGDAKKIPGDGWAVSLSFSLTLLNIL